MIPIFHQHQLSSRWFFLDLTIASNCGRSLYGWRKTIGDHSRRLSMQTLETTESHKFEIVVSKILRYPLSASIWALRFVSSSVHGKRDITQISNRSFVTSTYVCARRKFVSAYDFFLPFVFLHTAVSKQDIIVGSAANNYGRKNKRVMHDVIRIQNSKELRT